MAFLNNTINRNNERIKSWNDTSQFYGHKMRFNAHIKHIMDVNAIDNIKSIKLTSPCYVEPPNTPHFYIRKLGFTGVYIISSFLL